MYSRLNRKLGQPPTLPLSIGHLRRVGIVSVSGGPGKNSVLAVRCTIVLVLGVGRGSEHLVIPGLIEEGLSDMHNAAGVRDERAGAEDQ